jgi:hypothetical protein
MKTKRVIFITLVMILMGTISANAMSFSATAVSQPWTKQMFIDGEDGVRNLSTAFVGKLQVPMLSYSRVGSPRIYQAHATTSAVAGNCGLDTDWYCNSWYDSDLIPGTVSQMATMQIVDTHLIKWAYATASTIRGATIELMNDMSFVDDSWQDLIQTNKFGSTLIGTPSLQITGGHYEMAVTIRDSTDLYGHKLVYMHYTGNDLKYSCLDSGSVYECDVIDQSSGFDSMGAPSLQVADDGATGITYYKAGEGVMYAYPHTPSPYWPSNCGPGGNTWRCITIFAGTETGILGNTVKLSSGKTRSESGIAFTYDDELIPVTLYHADYVSSGGNCGSDFGFGGLVAQKWQCDVVIGLGDFVAGYTPSYSIAIDPQGYSVIAFDYAMSDFSPFDLYIAYPKARVGDVDPGFFLQKIDGAPVEFVDTGPQAAISLNHSGLGFIGYLQKEDYELPDLKIAWQQFETYLPSIMR